MDLRDFAVAVVSRLQNAGFEALFAGGCVRDQLMGLQPKDYDVATSATPDEVRQLFGHRKTLPIGAAFGVISVIGPRRIGQVEVATFRKDAEYSDGRHPDSVEFTNAQEDARRRDFTINGMFYNPITEQVIDYVGGRQDIEIGCVRAIGDPRQRIHEDKLRMLRAVRFAATFNFKLDPATEAAITKCATEIQEISAERIGTEFNRILASNNRARGVELMLSTGLLKQLVPQSLVPEFSLLEDNRLDILNRLAKLNSDRFEPALFLLFQPCFLRLTGEEDWRDAFPANTVTTQNSDKANEGIYSWIESLREKIAIRGKRVAQLSRQVQNRLKLTNQQRDDLAWIANHWQILAAADRLPWALLQPLLLHPAAELGLKVIEAIDISSPGLKFCRMGLNQSTDQFNPPYFLTGEDLIRLGLKPSPEFKNLIQQVRDRQLEGNLDSRAAAEAWVLKRQSRC